VLKRLVMSRFPTIFTPKWKKHEWLKQHKPLILS
jgi:hypothetical protein